MRQAAGVCLRRYGSEGREVRTHVPIARRGRRFRQDGPSARRMGRDSGRQDGRRHLAPPIPGRQRRRARPDGQGARETAADASRRRTGLVRVAGPRGVPLRRPGSGARDTRRHALAPRRHFVRHRSQRRQYASVGVRHGEQGTRSRSTNRSRPRGSWCVTIPAPSTLTLDGKPVRADQPCNTLRPGLNELYRQTEPFRLEAGEHVLAIEAGGSDTNYFLPVAWLAGDFAVENRHDQSLAKNRWHRCVVEAGPRRLRRASDLHDPSGDPVSCGWPQAATQHGRALHGRHAGRASFG